MNLKKKYTRVRPAIVTLLCVLMLFQLGHSTLVAASVLILATVALIVLILKDAQEKPDETLKDK